MKRPVTLFTGQWADLTLEEVCKKAAAFGYDGLELACWGDHIEVEKADQAYCDAKLALLKKYNLTDPALLLLGEIVRAADSHPANPHPAGEGLRWVAFGFSALGLSDHEILKREFVVYDALYAECRRRVAAGA